MTAHNMPCHTTTNNRDTVSREQADCSNWKLSSFSIIIFMWAYPFVDFLSVIELIEGCANRSNAFCWACDTTECVRQMSVQFLHIIQWNNNRMFIEDLWYFQQIIFLCALVCTHVRTHCLVLARKTGYHWKCYLTGYSIVYLPVWESWHPQLCVVANITCSQNNREQNICKSLL
jgi:hypothetical protein